MPLRILYVCVWINTNVVPSTVASVNATNYLLVQLIITINTTARLIFHRRLVLLVPEYLPILRILYILPWWTFYRLLSRRGGSSLLLLRCCRWTFVSCCKKLTFVYFCGYFNFVSGSWRARGVHDVYSVFAFVSCKSCFEYVYSARRKRTAKSQQDKTHKMWHARHCPCLEFLLIGKSLIRRASARKWKSADRKKILIHSDDHHKCLISYNDHQQKHMMHSQWLSKINVSRQWSSFWHLIGIRQSSVWSMIILSKCVSSMIITLTIRPLLKSSSS